MQQRAQIFHRRPKPSSATQLPIAAALNAENLTLLVPILHDKWRNVKKKIDIFLSNTVSLWKSESSMKKALLEKTGPPKRRAVRAYFTRRAEKCQDGKQTILFRK